MCPKVRFMWYTNEYRETKRLRKIYDKGKIYIYKQKNEEPCQKGPQV